MFNHQANRMKFLYILFCLIVLFQTGTFAQNTDSVPVLNHHHQIKTALLDSLNSTFRETNISLSPDGQFLFFMSDRGQNPWSNPGFGTYKGKKMHDGDIWFSQKVKGQWQKAHSLDSMVNTKSGEDEPMISPDGQFVTYQSWKKGWQSSGGPYYCSELNGTQWEKPVGLGSGINSFFSQEYIKYQKYATDGASLSPDGHIFLVACGPLYDGPLDIMISRKSQNGNWSFPKKAAISTKRDERSVFIAADGKTIFFASNGYGGFGGLDIFKTSLNENGTFGPVVNIGEPFNTTGDDYGFVLTASGKEAYFIREGDIYFADISKADSGLYMSPTLLISGIVTDFAGKPESADVFLYREGKKEILEKAKSNAISGKFSLSVSAQKGSYVLETISRTKGICSQKINISENIFTEMIINPVLEATPKNNFIPSDSLIIIYFDFDSYELKNQYLSKLKTISAYLIKNPGRIIRLTGHTDSTGTISYNDLLGMERAKSVSKFLLSCGVNKNQVRLFSEGEKKPASSDSGEKGYALNRRVEISISQ